LRRCPGFDLKTWNYCHAATRSAARLDASQNKSAFVGNRRKMAALTRFQDLAIHSRIREEFRQVRNGIVATFAAPLTF
jgi:hypothetical protein